MTLTSFERRWTATVARALVPADALGGALADIDVGARFAGECAASPWYVALGFRAALLLVWLWPLVRLRTFGGLDEAGRVATLEQLLKHRAYPIRMGTMMLKLTLLSLLLGDEATLAQLGAYKLSPRALVRHKEAS